MRIGESARQKESEQKLNVIHVYEIINNPSECEQKSGKFKRQFILSAKEQQKQSQKNSSKARAMLRWKGIVEECARVAEYYKCKMHIFAKKNKNKKKNFKFQ